ncbi:hypothetical protein CsSME_00038390 [Camellia sinensis var. sinensis]
MVKKQMRRVSEVLWRLFYSRVRTLIDTIIFLIPPFRHRHRRRLSVVAKDGNASVVVAIAPCHSSLS